MNTETRSCQNCTKEFIIAPEDFEFYTKIKVPPPTFCHLCRMQRRIACRNDRALFKRKCDATGADIFTMFHPDAPYKVYEREYWWSDAWDATEYGREYDFSRPFFEQYGELMREVPWFSRSILDMVNSDYCMNAGWLKDCYMVFDASYDEGCFYSVGLVSSKDSAEMLACEKCELSYDCFGCIGCYKTFHSVECENCRDTSFSKNCTNCSNVAGCVNLKNKQYHIFNEPYTKEDYEKKLKEFRLDTHDGAMAFRAKFEEFAKSFPVRSIRSSRVQDVSGDYIYNSKNVKEGYLVHDTEDSRYCQFLQTPPGVRDSYDVSVFGANSELIYESLQGFVDVSRLFFTNYMYPASHDCEYSIACPSSSYLFGCIGLKKKQYCIFNKQYTKEEYEVLVPKIKDHMNEMPYQDKKGNVYRYGEFFPIEFSPFAYNETTAQDFFPLDKETATAQGYLWRDPSSRNYTTTLEAKDVPSSISETPDTITSQAIRCEDEGNCSHGCTTAYRISPGELELCRRLEIPLPHLCFSCRHASRLAFRNPVKLWTRSCAKCEKEIQTSYAPDRPEIVYCEQCYNAEVA